MKCKVCGTVQEKPPHYSYRQWKTRQFCSRVCGGKALVKVRKLSHWKGGRSIAGAGYIAIYAPHHPHATKHKTVMEHRLVMEKYLGRLLKKTEHVHHQNGNKSDNQLENLEAVDGREHNRRHAIANGLGKDRKNYRSRDLLGRFT